MTQLKVTSFNKTKASDIIKLLKADHDNVKTLFEEFEKVKEKGDNSSKKEKIVKQICEQLTLHALVEESIVYPAAREVIDDEDIMDEADVEHAGAKELISQLQSMSPDDSHYDAKVTVLREYIEHHVKEEETIMFPKLAKSDINGEEMAEEVVNFKVDHKHSESKISSKKDNKEAPLIESKSARSTHIEDEKSKKPSSKSNEASLKKSQTIHKKNS